MKKKDEEAIQALIEAQINGSNTAEPLNDSKEEQLYRTLFKELSHDPFWVDDIKLADTLLLEIQKRQDNKDKIYYNLVIAAMVTVAIFLSCLAITMVNSSLLDMMLSLLKNNEQIVLFLVSTVVIIQISDHLFKKHTLKKVTSY
ncbi:hypothetical protein CKK33_14790 [Mucilaginibacter sp. MD40]|uniref:hypothetical protein n=1 Tax=Mucilaginibacter sp. MD40 TaxID=2029590 RepID=UPI000BAC5F35|nr:hypothetical protein [Mucilaginibacter sp. MD40]PAW94692.1 hypothetical protein CKK33_14790 [Mucilaginibacter sp. MD40]